MGGWGGGWLRGPNGVSACLVGWLAATLGATLRRRTLVSTHTSPLGVHWVLVAAAVKADLPAGTSQKEVMQALSQKYAAQRGSSSSSLAAAASGDASGGSGGGGGSSSSGAVSSLLDKMNLQA